MVRETIRIADSFWQQHPALLYGLSYLLGCFLFFSWSPLLAFPAIILFVPLLIFPRCHPTRLSRLVLSLTTLTAAYGLCYASYRTPSLPAEGIEGMAEVRISALALKKTPFGQAWQLSGQLTHFAPRDPSKREFLVRNGTVHITFPWKPDTPRPKANGTYRLKGKLTQRGATYRLRTKIESLGKPKDGSWSLADWRYEQKLAFATMVQQRVPDRQVASFLAGLATGDFSDPQLASALGRFGLQHIMAISGFHFSLMAGILSLVLSCMLPRRAALQLLIVLLSCYLLFLGPGPSIMRAWTSAMVLLLGQLLHKRHNGLNALGMGLLIVLLFDPALCLSLAFQLSFLATGSILLFYAPVEQATQLLLPKRPLHLLAMMHGWDQHAVVLLAMLRGTLALGIAVHIVMLPMALFAFQKFPWLSLVYNLFFPFLVSVSMFLLFLALPLQFLLPSLAALLHTINTGYTRWVLHLTTEMPHTFDFVLRWQMFPASWLIVYLSLISVVGVILWNEREKRREEREDFAFL